MGAAQSSANGAANSSTEVKTSYYELLSLTRQATDDEIKKAYRRKALELHPDRNFGNEEAATKTFAEIQAAYQVLSDPQERAWYDSHESAILRGDDAGDADGVPTYENVRITTADDLARMLRKFNSNVEFTDAPSGFFGYVRETFDQLAQEEEIAANWDNIDVREYPTFGHKDDAYEDVVKQFYAAWSSFSTVKSFSWKDKHRLSEAPDRWYRRRMEEENKRFRKDGVREFNDAVRSLVAFIRKRDPRYVPSSQSEAERQNVLRDAAKAQAARARAANAANLEGAVPDWAQIHDSEPEQSEEGDEDEEPAMQIFECVACNKEFKSEKQWLAHERSKKHQKALYALQKKMRKENKNLDLIGTEPESGVITPMEVEEEDFSEDGEALDDHVDELEEQEVQMDEGGETPLAADVNEGTRSEDNEEETQETANKNPAEPNAGTPDAVSESEDDEYTSPETVQARLQGLQLDTPPTTAADTDEADDSPAAGKKMGKAAQKRAKRAAAAATNDSAESTHKCASCAAPFPSKTQLFQHIKDHGHAALKTATANGGAKGKKGKSKK